MTAPKVSLPRAQKDKSAPSLLLNPPSSVVEGDGAAELSHAGG